MLVYGRVSGISVVEVCETANSFACGTGACAIAEPANTLRAPSSSWSQVKKIAEKLLWGHTRSMGLVWDW